MPVKALKRQMGKWPQLTSEDSPSRHNSHELTGPVSALISRIALLEPGSLEWRKCIAQIPPCPASSGKAKAKAKIDGVFIIPDDPLSPGSQDMGYVHGWALHSPDTSLWIEDECDNLLIVPNTARVMRPDVTAAHTGHKWDDGNAGFLLRLPQLVENRTYYLRTLTAHGVLTLDTCKAERVDLKSLLSRLPLNAVDADGHLGAIDEIFVSPAGGAVAQGWALTPPEACVWFQDDSGNISFISDAFRRHRADIKQGFADHPWSDHDSAFVIHLPGEKSPSSIRMKVLTPKGVHLLSEKSEFETLPRDPRRAAERLFMIATEERRFHDRASKVDIPLLKPLIAEHSLRQKQIRPRVKEFGTIAPDPAVSIIVPLYGRYDFVEHQLLKFSQDRNFRSRYELIYIVDDPRMNDNIEEYFDYLFKLFNIPLKIILGVCNRGFSGANNLAADYANGNALLFLNSDVFPQYEGWVEALLDELDSEASIGAVGPRLVYATGGIQHAGMRFEFEEKFGIWLNRHPYSGLTPSLDPASIAEDASAVTGACILIKRDVFDRIDGWSTNYLVGDFEDSHLCLAVRQKGYRVRYLPTVQLTHLERQSFKSIGNDPFKLRLTIFNAVQHQESWSEQLQRDDAQPAAANLFPRDMSKELA